MGIDMPVSKPRVKKNGKRPTRKNKWMLDSIFLPEEKIKKVRELFTNVEMISETKLHRGVCNFDDVAMMRDVLNMCAWSSIYWAKVSETFKLSDEWIDENMPIFLKAQDAFHTFYSRGNSRGGIENPEIHYVATGDELTAIRDGIAVAGDLCQQMLNDSPIQFLRLFDAMKRFLRHEGAGKLEFDGDKLAQSIRRS